MYGDVNVTIGDQKAVASIAGIGAHVKIGVGLASGAVPVRITGSMDSRAIRAKLGVTPVASACMDAVENGANEIYCVAVSGAVKGGIGEVTHTGTGTALVEVQGSPLNSYTVAVNITEAGKRNEGAFSYSLDGENFSDEITIPADGQYDLEGTGLTLAFGDTAAGGFVQGDVFTVSTTAPEMSNQEVLDAVDAVGDMNVSFEYIHIVGASGRVLWSALAAVANLFLTERKRPCFFVCEGRVKRDEETLGDYVEAMKQERMGISSMFLQVVCSHSEYTQMDGAVSEVNNAGIITGLYSKAKESQSIGEVRSFPIPASRLHRLLPEGIEKYLGVLDKAGYLTVRQYTGLEDYYVANANMLAPEGSSYQHAEDVRVVDKLIKEVRLKALEELQREIDLSDIKASLVAVQANLNIPVETAARDGIISGGRVEIDDLDEQEFIKTESVGITIYYIPKGHVREINLTFTVENPYA